MVVKANTCSALTVLDWDDPRSSSVTSSILHVEAEAEYEEELPRRYSGATKHMKMCSTSLAFKATQLKPP